MKLYEFQGKELLDEYSIPTPERKVVKAAEEISQALNGVNMPVMVKAQILQGGRGKAGGIKKAASADEANILVSSFLSNPLKNEKVNSVLLEEVVDIENEYFLGITIDDRRGAPVVLVSSEGGMDIEELAKHAPEKIVRYFVNPAQGLRQYEAILIAKKLNLAGMVMTSLANIIYSLYQLFVNNDAHLAEINPLIFTRQGQFVGGDAKVIINDDALFRQKKFSSFYVEEVSENKFEALARSKGFHYIDMTGEVGVVSIGAGYGMMVLDVVSQYGLRPANYIDARGGATRDNFSSMVDIVISKANKDPNVKVIFASCGLAATPLENIVLGITDALEKRPSRVPLVANITADGPSVANLNLEGAAKIFAEAGVHYNTDFQLAVKDVIRFAKIGA